MKKFNKRLDEAFSAYIRLRDRYTCQVCKRKGDIPKSVRKYNEARADEIENDNKPSHGLAMECSHHVNRTSQSVRWYDRNAECLCREHHMMYENKPEERTNKLDELRLKSNDMSKIYVFDKVFTKYQKDDILNHIKSITKNL